MEDIMKAIATKDWSSRLMDAYMDGFITRAQLKNYSNMLPDMKKTFGETMDAIFEMTEQLIDGVIKYQKKIPTDGSISEGAANQAVIEAVKTGSAQIRKVSGLMEGGI